MWSFSNANAERLICLCIIQMPVITIDAFEPHSHIVFHTECVRNTNKLEMIPICDASTESVSGFSII